MPYHCTDDPNEILEYVAAAKTNAQKFNTFVNGSSTQTVQLGTGDPTPVLRKFIADAQNVVATAANEAAETVLDDVADMMLNKADKVVNASPGNLARLDSYGNLRDAGRAAEDFVLLLAYTGNEAMKLTALNRIGFGRYRDWYASGIERLRKANHEAMQAVQNIRDLIKSFDESRVRHRLQLRLFNGINPGSSSKPVLFVISGQSNAVGTGEYGAFDKALDCGWQWNWRDTSSPSLVPIKDPQATVSNRGSQWPAFARLFFALTGRKVLLFNIASGGSAVTPADGYENSNSWADDGFGTLRATRQTAWNNFANAGLDYDLGAILWSQGETDAGLIYSGRISALEYKAATLDVLNWTRSLVGDSSVPVLNCKIGYNKSGFTTNQQLKLGYEAVHKAQKEIFNGQSGLYMSSEMPPRFAYAWDEYMYGGIHYGALGYDIVGKAFARSAALYLNLA